MRNGTRLLFSGVLWLALLVLPAPVSAQSGDTNKVHADYRNVLYIGTPPSVPPNGTPNLAAQLPEFNSVAFYSGSAALSTNANSYPGDGTYFLKRSVIGTPLDGWARVVVGGRQFKFGEAITNIASLGRDDARQPASIEPTNGARFVPGMSRTVGTEVGFVTITWYRTNGTVNSPVTYYIQDEPVKEPVRIYWTKDAAGKPTGAPTVNLPADLTVTPYYNAGITPAVLQLSGGVLNAQNGRGKIVLDYTNSTTHSFTNLEILDIRPFEQDHLTGVDIGAWLTPQTNRSNIKPLVSRGLTTNEVVVGPITNKIPPYAFQFLREGDTNHGKVFAVRPEVTATNIEVFWFRTSLAGVVWPYEMHRYTSSWPADFGTVARRIYVTQNTADRSPTLAPPVNIPSRDVPSVSIHYNDAIPAVEPTNPSQYLWLDSSRNLNARAPENLMLPARILLHYERPTLPGFIGLQFVEIVDYARTSTSAST
jgi:hypothetical protein